MALRAFRPLLAKVRTSRASAPRSATIAASANAAPATPAAAAAEPAAAVSKFRPVGLTAPEAARLAANPPIQPQFFTRTKTSAGIGAPVPLSTPQPLDPRHFRLPNVLFKMVRVGPRNVSPVTKPLVGLANSRKQTRGAPIQPRPVPREHDPYLVAFRVPLNFNKLQIRNYLEELYKIDIVSVNTLIYLGMNRQRQRQQQ